ncbi:SRPBCC family protein [Peribacillus sp. NPDC096448]|uniref:SRPBCC family protein n=1 Tax=Peribacillus sp. NPDC096448 TaxID=3364395 RepID=UPI003815F777
MWTYEHSVDTRASKEAIWDLYSNIEKWTDWDKSLKSVSLENNFSEGTKGTMLPVGQKEVCFKLVDVNDKVKFTSETSLTEAVKMSFVHKLTSVENNGVRITHRVVISGPGAKEIGAKIGPFLTKDIPETMNNLAEQALNLDLEKKNV